MKKPKIRFKGFNDDWEQRKLGKIFVSMQNNTLSRADLSYDSGVAMNVHYGDILVKFGEVLDIKSERLPMIVDETVLDKYKSSFLKNGDIIIADTAEDETVGKCTEIAGLSDEYVISGLHTIPYRPLQKFAFGYLGYYMNSTSYHNQLLPLMQGIKVTSISKVSLQNTVIIYPKSKVEQAAIGKYFYNLDNLITLHQRKCDEIKELKKYMLQNMFPQNDEKAPKIRFNGFTDDWEQRKFGKIVKTRRGLTYKPSDICENGIRVLRSSNINEDRFILKDDDIFVSKQSVNIDFVKENDILITAANGSSKLVGKHAILSNIANNSTVHGGFMLIASTTEPHFINAYMGASWYKKFINLYVAGGNGAIGNLNKNDLDNQEILIPSEYEQKKIGLYFSQLDNLITLHQRKCDELKNMKKFMLQNMFV